MNNVKDYNLNKNCLRNIKSNYVLRRMFKNLKENKFMEILKYNKELQKILNIDINDYIEYKNIEIEIIPLNKSNKNIFANIPKQEKCYYHVYFNDNKNEAKRNYFTKEENISRIKIVIDSKVKSINNLFRWRDSIEKINFIKNNRTDISDLSRLFLYCSSLKEININKLIADNVIDMSDIFYGCS